MDQQRFVALDVHKSYVMVGAVNAKHDIVLTPRRVALTILETWCQKHLHPSDEVVLEATTNAWQIHDLLKPLVSRVVVAHPYHVKLIASSFSLICTFEEKHPLKKFFTNNIRIY